MDALAALLLASTGTFALRYCSVRLLAERTMDPRVAVVLRHAALGIIASLAVAALPSEGELPVSDAAATCGLAVAIVAGRRVGSASLTIALAVATYAAARGLTGP